MGLEARCQVTWKGEAKVTGVHLDSAVVEVRGRPALKLPFASVRRASVRAGDLVLESDEGTLVLSLGDAAIIWAAKITSPPSRTKKLGVKAGQRVCIIGVTDTSLEADVRAAGAELVSERARADMLFYAVTAPRDLDRLPELRASIATDGAIWVLRTKGKNATVKEGEVMSAARASGLVDVKVVAFSETHSADKLVIPVAERTPAAGQKPTAKRAALPPKTKAKAPKAAVQTKPTKKPAAKPAAKKPTRKQAKAQRQAKTA